MTVLPSTRWQNKTRLHESQIAVVAVSSFLTSILSVLWSCQPSPASCKLLQKHREGTRVKSLCGVQHTGGLTQRGLTGMSIFMIFYLSPRSKAYLCQHLQTVLKCLSVSFKLGCCVCLQSPHFKIVLWTLLKGKYTTGELQSTTAMTHYHLLYTKPSKTSKHFFISNLLICCYFNMNSQIKRPNQSNIANIARHRALCPRLAQRAAVCVLAHLCTNVLNTVFGSGLPVSAVKSWLTWLAVKP